LQLFSTVNSAISANSALCAARTVGLRNIAHHGTGDTAETPIAEHTTFFPEDLFSAIAHPHDAPGAVRAAVSISDAATADGDFLKWAETVRAPFLHSDVNYTVFTNSVTCDVRKRLTCELDQEQNRIIAACTSGLTAKADVCVPITINDYFRKSPRG